MRNSARQIIHRRIPRCTGRFAGSRQSIFPEVRWSLTLPAGTRRIRDIARWGSMPTGLILIPRQKKKAVRSTGTTRGSVWKKFGEDQESCLTWSPEWRERIKRGVVLFSATVLFILFDDEMIRHSRNVIA